MTKRIFSIAFSLMWGVLAFSMAGWTAAPVTAVPHTPADVTDLRINEFMASNTTVITDGNGEFNDWIEIYNMGNTPVDMQGLYMSDDPLLLTKYQFPSSLIIPAGGYLLLFADSVPEAGELPFALNVNGESIFIVNTDGTSVIDTVTFGPQTANVSEARIPDGTGPFVFTSFPTPGQSNAAPPELTAVQHTPAYPTSSDTVQVTAAITDDGSIQSATLFYSINGTAFASAAMQPQGGDVYAADIPAQSQGTVISYYVEAEDDLALTTIAPTGAPTTTYGYVVGYTPPTLVINEFAAQPTPLEDPDEPGTFPDWLEIHNYGDTAVNLDGLYLTDDPATPRKFVITDGLTIPAHSYLLFIADAQTIQGPLHTNFALGATESVAIVGAQGFDVIDSDNYAGALVNTSYGRLPNGTGPIDTLPTMTPGRSNELIYNVGHTPTQPTSSDVVTVSATISDAVGTVDTADLIYTVDGGAAVTLPMSAQGVQWQATIPAQVDGSVVRYDITVDYTDPVTFTTGTIPGLHGYVVGYTPPVLYINEFMASNTATYSDTIGGFHDWIELYNPGPDAVNLGGLFLTDDTAAPTNFPISSTLSIPANGFILFYAANVPVAISNTAEALLYTGFGLSANGEDVGLYGAEGFVAIDLIENYEPQTADISYGRVTDGNPLFQYFTLGTADFPSPNASNDRQAPIIANVAHTPTLPTSSQSVSVTADVTDNGELDSVVLYYRLQGGGAFTAAPMTNILSDTYESAIPAQADGSVVEYYLYAADTTDNITTSPADAPTTTYTYTVFDPPQLLINEYLAFNLNGLTDPDEPTERPDWIEIYNPSGTAVSLDGFYLTNNLSNPTLFPIPAGLTIPAGGYILFYADGEPAQGSQHTNFTLATASGAIGLYGAGGSVPIDTRTYAAQAADVSEGRYPNGDVPFRKFYVPTPGAENLLNGPVISGTAVSPHTAEVGKTIIITTQIVDDGQLITATLTYRINGGAPTTVDLTPQANNQFRGTIPPQALGAVVQYTIAAGDDDSLVSTFTDSVTIAELSNFTIYLPLVVKP